MLARINSSSLRAAQTFVDTLPAMVRRNMFTELWGTVMYGVFYAASIQFIPVVLRRMGASSEVLAFYTSLTYLGAILTSFSIVLMRRRRTKTFAVVSWAIGRSLFLFFAVITGVPWVLALMAVFWFLELFPSPAYTRIVQAIYPEAVRGKAMSVVRMGMVVAIVCVTPLAGWALDQWGYQVLFPAAGLAGLAAVWYFNRLDVDEGVLPPRQTRTLASLWGIVRRNRRFAIHLISFSVYGLGALLGFAYYPIVQVDRLQLSYTQIGLLGLAQSLAWLLAFLYWGRAVDRKGGLAVLRTNLAIGAIIPFSYLFATEGWMLLPAFIAQGIISAGVDLGLVNTCIQLAEPDSVVDYAAVQSTVVGLRGMIAPFIGVALIQLGVAPGAVFALGGLLVLASWLIMGAVHLAPPTGEALAQQKRLRYRWPIRFRAPRV